MSRLPRTTRADLLPALRVTVSVVCPLVVLRVTGHLEASLYAAFGAFASVYARRGPHLDRLVMQSGAGALQVACVTAGTAVSSLAGGPWPAVVGTAVAAAVASAASDVLRWLPPGPLFAVFAFGACAAAPAEPRDIGTALLVGTGSALFAVVVGACGAVLRLRRREPGTVPRVRPPGDEVVRRALTYFLAALLAGGSAAAVGLHHGYWAAVAAVVPLAASGTEGRLQRAWHRLWGTAAGLVVAAVLLVGQPGGWAVVGFVAVLQVGAELFVLHHYATAMVFVTPMALLMTRLGPSGPLLPLLSDRAVTTLLGVAVGVGAVLVLHDRRADAPD